MKNLQLNEDKLPNRLLVAFSNNISKEIEKIDVYNRNNVERISRWHDYIDGIKRYMSNPVIAWDYTNRCQRFPNGTRFLSDLGYNVGYTIKTNNCTQQTYVYIFMVNLNPKEYGLKVPPTLNENKQPTNRIVYHLKESQLRRIIRESIKKMLVS